MLTNDFNYHLPPELIAQTPATPRDSSRLMAVDRNVKKIDHKHFSDIVNYLGAGDLLVWNNTKVFKARLRGTLELDRAILDDKEKEFCAAQKSVAACDRILNVPRAVEIFLVRPMENKCVWKVLAKPGKKLRLGMRVRFASDFIGEVMLKENDGTILMDFGDDDDMVVRAKANKYGEVPVPPYVRNDQIPMTNDQVSERYQTVYAKHEGSVAAPTAGFHFTPELIEKLKTKGVEFAEVTLHVGLGTFLPVKTDNVEDHKMHSEWVELTAKNADLINAAKAEGRRVVAVGTTTVRVLEGIASLFPLTKGERKGVADVEKLVIASDGQPHLASTWKGEGAMLRPYSGDINIFITPGFQFKIVDALITNFHLPKSTLLMLVCAFAGDREFVLKCYEQAVAEKYRFYSFGDAMMIK